MTWSSHERNRSISFKDKAAPLLHRGIETASKRLRISVAFMVCPSSSGEGRLVGIGGVMRNCRYGQP